MKLSVLIAGAAFIGGCSDTTFTGGASACVVGANDSDNGLAFETQGQRTGLRLVSPDEQTAPPETFANCSSKSTAQAEVVDDTGEHLWLAVGANLDGNELIPDAIFNSIENSTLSFHQFFGFLPRASFFLMTDTQPIIALQGAMPLDSGGGALGVEDAGGSALPTFGTCGSVTNEAIRFVDDSGAVTANNGETVDLVIGGEAFRATNILSNAYGESNCEDAPSDEIDFTWFAVSSSL